MPVRLLLVAMLFARHAIAVTVDPKLGLGAINKTNNITETELVAESAGKVDVKHEKPENNATNSYHYNTPSSQVRGSRYYGRGYNRVKYFRHPKKYYKYTVVPKSVNKRTIYMRVPMVRKVPVPVKVYVPVPKYVPYYFSKIPLKTGGYKYVRYGRKPPPHYDPRYNHFRGKPIKETPDQSLTIENTENNRTEGVIKEDDLSISFPTEAPEENDNIGSSTRASFVANSDDYDPKKTYNFETRLNNKDPYIYYSIGEEDSQPPMSARPTFPYYEQESRQEETERPVTAYYDEEPHRLNSVRPTTTYYDDEPQRLNSVGPTASNGYDGGPQLLNSVRPTTTYYNKKEPQRLKSVRPTTTYYDGESQRLNSVRPTTTYFDGDPQLLNSVRPTATYYNEEEPQRWKSVRPTTTYYNGDPQLLNSVRPTTTYYDGEPQRLNSARPITTYYDGEPQLLNSVRPTTTYYDEDEPLRLNSYFGDLPHSVEPLRPTTSYYDPEPYHEDHYQTSYNHKQAQVSSYFYMGTKKPPFDTFERNQSYEEPFDSEPNPFIKNKPLFETTSDTSSTFGDLSQGKRSTKGYSLWPRVSYSLRLVRDDDGMKHVMTGME